MPGIEKEQKYTRLLPSLSRFPVLVVEDDTAQRELLVETLRMWGLVVFEADSGESALRFLDESKEAVRLIITDIQMPGIDGIAFLRRIRKGKPGRFYFIAISGFGDRDTVQQSLDAGATDFLKKPYLPEQLFARLAVLDRLIALEQNYQDLVKGLFDVMTEMLGSRDKYTLEHSLRVAALSKKVGERLGLGENELNVLEIGCLVHDVGKIAIPDNILLKPGPFDALDRKIMNLHPLIGVRFLASRYPDRRVHDIILQHHERLDGSGYPDGIGKSEINPLVLIVSPCDVYEALIAHRPYRIPMTKEAALAILEEEASKGRFDMEVVHALGDILEGWDPLSISRDVSKYLEIVESFRRREYFREPLCCFYNYRYINFLELEREEILGRAPSYTFVIIDFKNVEALNKRLGYIMADEILDEIGDNILDILGGVCSMEEKKVSRAILFRKGPDFWILTSYSKNVVERMKRRVCEVLENAKRDWGLRASLCAQEFPSSTSFLRALNLIMEQEEEGLDRDA